MSKVTLVNLSGLFALQPEQAVIDALLELQYQRYWADTTSHSQTQRFFASVWHSRTAYQLWLKSLAAYHILSPDGMINRYKKGLIDTRTFLTFLLDKVCPALNTLAMDNTAYATLQQQGLLSTSDDAAFSGLSDVQRYRLALLEQAWNAMIGEVHANRVTQLHQALQPDPSQETILISNTNPAHVRCILGKFATQLTLTSTPQTQQRYELNLETLQDRLHLCTSYDNGEYKTDGLLARLATNIRAQNSTTELSLISHWQGDRTAAQALQMSAATPEQYFNEHAAPVLTK